MNRINYIGKVKLDYNNHCGEDLYTDGAIEEDILHVVRKNSAFYYHDIIEIANDWAFLYHLSHLRQNIVEWLPINKSHKVLEIGSGCGAITGILAEKAGQVVCVDLSEARSLINAYRNEEHDNITIYLGNFKDIEPRLTADFDFILFVGVFEYCCLYLDMPAKASALDDGKDDFDPYIEMLKIAKRHLTADGHIAIAIENRFGLKYWAGCPEDHLGTFFSGLEDYPDGGNARTFTRPHLEKMLEAAGIGEYNFYYPYPDYKFMTTLFSEARLPAIGELYDNDRNFDRHRMELFNEKIAFDSIIADGLFPLFSNSFFVYTGKDTETAYLRYSNDRALEYQIRTEITKGNDLGPPIVRKVPLTPEAEAHTKKMVETYHLLLKQYEDTDLVINKCWLAADGKSAEFEFLNGKTLTEQLDECLKNEDEDLFYDLVEKFRDLANVPGKSPEVVLLGHPLIVNHDFIFSNIILDNDNQGKWTLIDYEWMLLAENYGEQPAYRALYCYLLEDESRKKKANAELFLRRWRISYEEVETYQKNEREFHDLVSGGRRSLAEIRARLGLIGVDPKQLVLPYLKRFPGRKVQVFFDYGEGFSEKESVHLMDAYQNENDVLVDITIPRNTLKLRLDPADMACVVMVRSLKWNGKEKPITRKYLKANGEKINNNCYLFKGDDPNFYISLKGLEEHSNRLEMQLEVAILPR